MKYKETTKQVLCRINKVTAFNKTNVKIIALGLFCKQNDMQNAKTFYSYPRIYVRISFSILAILVVIEINLFSLRLMCRQRNLLRHCIPDILGYWV